MPQPLPMKPLESGVADLSLTILEQAGLKPDQLAFLLSEAVNVIHEALSAEKTVRLSYKGETVETHTEIDWQTRLKAADSLANLTVNVSGLKKSPDQGPKAPVTVTVNLPGQISPGEKVVNP